MTDSRTEAVAIARAAANKRFHERIGLAGTFGAAVEAIDVAIQEYHRALIQEAEKDGERAANEPYPEGWPLSTMPNIPICAAEYLKSLDTPEETS